MRFVSFAVGGHSSFGVVRGNAIADVGKALGGRAPTLGALLRAGEFPQAMEIGSRLEPTVSLDSVRYLPIVPDPEKLICIGINYGNRNEEYKDGAEAPKYPSVFMRTPGSLVGHQEPIWNPPESEQLDYEGEIVLVIGRSGRRIAEKDAWRHVAGLSLMNEGSVRDWLRHSKFNVTPGKNFERSGSFGPWLMTPDEFGDPADHTLVTRLNGIERQRARMSGMLFDVPRIIEYLSEGYTLQPGDVIVTGSPGALPLRPGEKPEKPVGKVIVEGQLHMRPGDVCEVEVDGLGVLSNPVIADPTPVR